MGSSTVMIWSFRVRFAKSTIAARVVGSEEKQVQLMVKRTEVREIMGEKAMQELIAR